jgi:hypothetical protein
MGIKYPNLGRRGDNRADDLERRVRELEYAMRRVPVRWPGAPPSAIRMLVITGGNTLSDGVTPGIKYSAVTDVPTLYDPAVDTSYIDGLGYGNLWVNGVDQGPVLIVNDGRAGSMINKALFYTDRVPVLTTSSIPLSGDPTQSVTAYVPYFT